MWLARFAKDVIRQGQLTIIDAEGRRHVAGTADGPSCTIRLHQRGLQYRLPLNPSLRLGEAYMDGTLTVEDGTLFDFLDLCARNQAHIEDQWVPRLFDAGARVLRWLHQLNSIDRARHNAAHHYNLSGAFYSLFLDQDLQYSCAYFKHMHDDLERAQEDKKRHIAAKLLLRPRQRVLDIGSGWGGLALHLAAAGAGEVVGISLAEEQVRVSRQRAEGSGLAGRVRFELRDYREQTGRFDRIVSVGMFEHVGVRNFGAFIGKIRELLTDDGVALLHSIGRMEGPAATNPWIRRYVFPGGYSPALSEVLPVIERAGLWVTDIEILRLHYAQTLRLWRRRFEANRARIAYLYDERFCRMWEFYLVASEVAFRRLDHMVFQIQLAKDRAAVPITRDYMTDADRAETATAVAAE